MAETSSSTKAARDAGTRDTDDAERQLGRYVALGLPVATVVVAIGMGFAFSIGLALLTLAGGALIGTIALLWASLRTLGGDAPLPEDMAALDASAHGSSEIEERKREVLRALKDLELEREVGKINEEDYEAIAANYREQAKNILRELDAEVEPYRARAEEIVRKHLARRGLGPDAAATGDEKPATAAAETAPAKEDAAPAAVRVACPKCATSNEADAAFCKKCGQALHEVAHAEA